MRSSPPAGTTITFPGYRQVYVESVDDAEASRGRRARGAAAGRSPSGQVVPVAVAHRRTVTATSPPARYTEASLVKRLEELGIGRPSTWASIIQTVQDRGYVWKKGQALVPTWTAFAVVGLMEKHFDEPRRLRVHRPRRGGPRLDRPQRDARSRIGWHDFYFGTPDSSEASGEAPARA